MTENMFKHLKIGDTIGVGYKFLIDRTLISIDSEYYNFDTCKIERKLNRTASTIYVSITIHKDEYADIITPDIYYQALGLTPKRRLKK